MHYAAKYILFKGNLSDQKQVTIFDPIHDTVRKALDRRYVWSGLQNHLSNIYSQVA